MSIFRSDAYRTARGNVHNTQRGTSALLRVRTGAANGVGGAGTLLGELTGNAAGWGSTVAGVNTANAITADSSADATGTAGHIEILTSAALWLESRDLNTGDGATIDNASIVAGQPIQLSGDFTITEPHDDGV